MKNKKCKTKKLFSITAAANQITLIVFDLKLKLNSIWNSKFKNLAVQHTAVTHKMNLYEALTANSK